MLIDLSHRLDNRTDSFPGDPTFSLVQIANFKENGYTNYKMSCGMHIGTHIDGRAHMTESSDMIGDANLDLFSGEAIVLDYYNQQSIDLNLELHKVDISNKIVLIYTNFDKYWGTKNYHLNHPILTLDFANYLIQKRVKLIGIDFPSPDNDPFEIHKRLLQNGLYILENLTGLNQIVLKHNIHLMAFPLRISADSSPVRAIVTCD